MELETYLQNELSAGTVKNYLYEIEKFRRHYRNPEKISYQNLMEYVELLRKNYNPQSIKRTIYAIKKYYDYLVETGKVKTKIVASSVVIVLFFMDQNLGNFLINTFSPIDVV
ncbi:site-specific integrase [Chryseobacterium sp. M5A1_1a]